MRPLLAALADGRVWSSDDIRRHLATEFSLTPQDLRATNPSGKNRYKNLVAWALHHLYRAKFVDRLAPSRYQITDRGRDVLRQYPKVVTVAVCAEFDEWHHSRAHRRARASNARGQRQSDPSNTSQAKATDGNRRRAPRVRTPPPVNRDLLIRSVFPDGVPPRDEVIRAVNVWLDEAERLAAEAADS